MSVVKFYDLLSVHPKTWWSANTYKTRLLLNYKRIPYTTIGVHYPDIYETSEKLGLKPAPKWPQWTLPVIEYEGTVVRGSFDIAKFLETKFPERRVIGEECEKWVEYITYNVVRAVVPMTVPLVPAILDERDAKFFRDTRKVPERKENHDLVVQAMQPLIKGIQEGGYIYGKRIHYADLVLASILVWILRTKEEDFKRIITAAGIEKWWEDMAQYL
jgi:glutathione S-transferase